MISAKGIRGQLPYNDDWKLLQRQQQTSDIIAGMLQSHKIDAKDYDKIADQFWRGSPEKTARCIFDFLKSNVSYKIEPDKKQTVRSPGAILHLGEGDCKHYALFTMGILDSLKRKGYPIGNACYRFASYLPGEKIPHHVFVVLTDRGRELWIDPVLPSFNYRKKYFSKVDKKAPNMSLSRVSGLPSTNYAFAPPPVAQKYVTQQEAREAFLTLLKLNIWRLSDQLKADMMANPRVASEITKVWQSFGGKKDDLLTSIDQGINTWRAAHREQIIGCDAFPKNCFGYDAERPMKAMIGLDPITLAAIISAGAGITKSIIDRKKKNPEDESGGGGSSIPPPPGQPGGFVAPVDMTPQQAAAAAINLFGGNRGANQTPTTTTYPPNYPPIQYGQQSAQNSLSNFYQTNKQIIDMSLLGLGALLIVPRVLDAVLPKKK